MKLKMPTRTIEYLILGIISGLIAAMIVLAAYGMIVDITTAVKASLSMAAKK